MLGPSRGNRVPKKTWNPLKKVSLEKEIRGVLERCRRLLKVQLLDLLVRYCFVFVFVKDQDRNQIHIYIYMIHLGRPFGHFLGL